MLELNRWGRLIRAMVVMAAMALALAGSVALPVLGQDPTPGPAASDKPGRGPKADKVPEVSVTLRGTVQASSGVDGETRYTLTSGGITYELEVGPPWWWGDGNPLEAAVGKAVTVSGEQAPGSTSVDVLAIDGTAIREPGRPPWAGGWKVVGEKHPGWAQWKVDKAAAKGSGPHGPPPWAGPKASDDANE